MPQPGEASVEEILESIKKVIARDNRAMANEARARRERTEERDAPDPAEPEEAEEILDLDEAAMVEDDFDSADVDGASSADRDTISSDDDGDADEPSGDDSETDSPLVNAAVRNAMRDNLAALAMLSTPPAAPQIVRSGETSLEGLVRDMLRPMLSDWLEENLPPMVERMVQAEISRISRKKQD